jgi:hypothetical protein
MMRFHVHVGVADLAAGVDFYSRLFGSPPTVRKVDYAKWMLDDPRVNFAILRRGALGVDHLGLQAESTAELAVIRARFETADASTTVAEPRALCCYAKSDKHWVTDPQGIPWEAFHTLDAIPLFGSTAEPDAQAGACCSPDDAAAPASPNAATCCATPGGTAAAATAQAPCCGPAGAVTFRPRTTARGA